MDDRICFRYMEASMKAFPSLLLAILMTELPLWGMTASRHDASPKWASHAASDQIVDSARPSMAKSTQQLVNIDVTVTDDQGRLLGGLKQDNFRISDNGQPRQIIHYAPPQTPMTVVLLMEYSSSSYQYYAAKSAYWADRFLDQLQPEDWVALVTYDLQPRVQVDFTHNSYAVREAIGGLGFPSFREANLFDSLMEVLERLDTLRGRKAILVIGTGLNSFSAATFDDVRQQIRRSDAIIFCVGTAEQEFVRYTGSAAGYGMAKNQFSSFARQTGGIAYFPRFEGELPDIYSSVAALLRQAYTLGFDVPEGAQDGRYHRLKVEVVDKDGKPLRVQDKQGKWHKVEVMAREGYIAPRHKSSSTPASPSKR